MRRNVWRALWSGAVGVVVGATALSGITTAVHALGSIWVPGLWQDGQFVMVHVLTIPVGALLGGGIGLAGVLLSTGRRRSAGATCILVGLPPLLFLGAWVWPDPSRLSAPWAGVPTGGAALCVVLGMWFLTTDRIVGRRHDEYEP